MSNENLEAAHGLLLRAGELLWRLAWVLYAEDNIAAVKMAEEIDAYLANLAEDD